MSWLDRYRQASFRNVNFYVQSHALEGGRRATIFEYPNNDNFTFQDFGKKSRTYTVEGYIVGEDYDIDRNRLIEALEKTDPGKLVHPYLGILIVKPLNYRLRETAGEGRVVRCSMVFSQASTEIIQVETENTQIEVISSRTLALEKINEVFIAGYAIAKKPYAVINNAQETITVGVEAIQAAKTIYDVSSDFQYEVQRMLDDVATLVGDADELNERTMNLLTFGTLSTDDPPATVENARKQFDNLLSLFTFGPVLNFGVGDPSLVYSNSIVRAAIAVCGGLISTMEFTSFDDAKYVQTLLFEKIDEILLAPETEDDVFTALRDLRTRVANDIESRAADLSRISFVKLPDFLPAVALSYDLYGTIDKEQEIIDRNKLTNPAFVPANRMIEILSDA